MDKELQPKRDKYWVEITSDEKVERLREIVKNLQNQIGNLSSQVYSLQNIINNHAHLSDGSVAQKVNTFGAGLGAATSSMKSLTQDPNKVYF